MPCRRLSSRALRAHGGCRGRPYMRPSESALPPTTAIPSKMASGSVVRVSASASTKVRSARIGALLVARIHTPSSCGSKGMNFDSPAASVSVRSCVHVPSPFLSTSKVMVASLSERLAIHAQRLSQPAKRNGSDGTPASTCSLSQRDPAAVVGPTLSGVEMSPNQILEFDCPVPPILPFWRRLLRNSL